MKKNSVITSKFYESVITHSTT